MSSTKPKRVVFLNYVISLLLVRNFGNSSKVDKELFFLLFYCQAETLCNLEAVWRRLNQQNTWINSRPYFLIKCKRLHMGYREHSREKTNTGHLFSDVHVVQHKMTCLAFASCVYDICLSAFFGVIEITHFLYCHG